MGSSVHHTSEEPKYIHFHELQVITEYFNKELGRGGFGVVYKGKWKEKEVAIKVLFERSQGNQDNEFREELRNLVKLNHPNIIRLVGYCCETHEKYDCRTDKFERVPLAGLCFEYAPNGNLRKYTFDENHRLDCPKVYNIIKGTCEGLYYLHHHSLGSMWHLDLKPENILLDHNMIPKIADFGLSKFFTNPTTKDIQIGGTMDYVPPEYKLRGRVTNKYDIFSLGVVIIEMMAGIGTYRIIEDFDSHEVIKLVLEKWNGILSGYYEEAKACIEIALKCVAIEYKNRPELRYIIDKLNETENTVPPTPLSQISSNIDKLNETENTVPPTPSSQNSVPPTPLSQNSVPPTPLSQNSSNIDKLNETENTVPPTPLSQNSSKYEESSTREIISSCSKELIQVEPLDLCFPYEPMKKVHSSSVLKLTNVTDDYVALILMLERRTAMYSADWSRAILPPGSTSENIIRRIPEGVAAARSMQCSDKFMVLSTVVSEGLNTGDITNDMFNKEMGRIVHEVTLDVVLTEPSSPLQQSSEGTPPHAPSILSPPAENQDCEEAEKDFDKLQSCVHNRSTDTISQDCEEAEKDFDKLQIGCCSQGKLLNVHTLQLGFPFPLDQEKDKETMLSCCPLHVTNNTGDHVAFRLLTKSDSDKYFIGPLFGVVPPRSRYTLAVTMRQQLVLPPADSDGFFTLESTIVDREVGLSDVNFYYNYFFTKAREQGREVHQVKLTAVYLRPGSKPRTMIILTYDAGIPIYMHPTEPWILTTLFHRLRILNYKTQEVRLVVNASFEIKSVAFIACRQWIVAGVSNGSIYIYSYDPIKEIHILRKHSKSVISLAIHPTEPYMLSASYDGEIKLWDYEKDWELIRSFNTNCHYMLHVVFHPKDANMFFSAQDYTLKIWNNHSGECKLTLFGHSTWVGCLDYFSCGDELYLISGSYDQTAKIWDYNTGCCVRTLEAHKDLVTAVFSHPDIPVLITGSRDGSVRLWDSTTFRAEGILNFGLGMVRTLGYSKGSRRIVVGCQRGLAVAEIGMIIGRE